jgi:hypothetical protein
LLLLATLLSASACQLLGQTDDDPCQRDDALFADDFAEDNLCGWRLFDGAGVSAEIEDSVMRLTVSSNGQITWSTAGRTFDDVVLSVDATQVSGPDNNAYGAICRYQDDENFYVFLISGDGYYAIGKYESGQSQVQYLTGESPYFYQESDLITQGSTTNDVRIRCQGDELALFVGGILVDEVTDDSFASGDIGLAASTFEASAVIIEFDNVRVVEP